MPARGGFEASEKAMAVRVRRGEHHLERAVHDGSSHGGSAAAAQRLQNGKVGTAMQRVLISGLILVVGMVALAAMRGLIGLDPIWPVLLAAAVCLVPGSAVLSRLGAFVVGAAAAWLGYGLRAAVLPDLAVVPGVAWALGIAIVTAVALATADRLPLWAGLAGMAAMSGMYEMMYRTSPPAFVTESVVAFTSVLLAGVLGAVAAMVTDALTRSRESVTPVRVDTAEETV
jgi:hypothetical protein